MMEKEPLQKRITERTIIEGITDRVITEVNEEFPEDGEARLRVYDDIADRLFSMVRALRPIDRDKVSEI